MGISLALSWQAVSGGVFSQARRAECEGGIGYEWESSWGDLDSTASSIQLGQGPVILLSLQSQWREQAAWSRRRTDNAASSSTPTPPPPKSPFPPHLNLFLIQMLSKRVMNFNIAPLNPPQSPFQHSYTPVFYICQALASRAFLRWKCFCFPFISLGLLFLFFFTGVPSFVLQ